ncbi:MAG: hypothetical protein OXD01_09875 [Gammaproteobacteria bacterium]|nr:hypothetical protein [Gammaproteobacteria bacterium]
MIEHDAESSSQFLEILASHLQRAIYSKNYRFDPVGKIIYSLLGMVLTVVSVTSICICLRRLSRRNKIDSMWIGIVGGVSLSLMLAMITGKDFDFVSILLF